MDYLEKILERISDWAREIIGRIIGPEAKAEPELIPIPVNDGNNRC